MKCKNIICYRDGKKVYCGSKKAIKIKDELNNIFCSECQFKKDFIQRLKSKFHNRKHFYVDECFPIEAVNAIIDTILDAQYSPIVSDNVDKQS